MIHCVHQLVTETILRYEICNITTVAFIILFIHSELDWLFNMVLKRLSKMHLFSFFDSMSQSLSCYNVAIETM